MGYFISKYTYRYKLIFFDLLTEQCVTFSVDWTNDVHYNLDGKHKIRYN